MRHISKPKVLLSVALVLLWLGFAAFPWISDDITYRLPFRSYFIDGEPYSFATLVDSLEYRYNHDNGRLANLAMYGLMCMPQWLLAMLSAAVCGIGIWLALKIIGLEKSLPATLTLTAAYVLLLPWVDQLYVFNWQLNYLWAGTLMPPGYGWRLRIKEVPATSFSSSSSVHGRRP